MIHTGTPITYIGNPKIELLSDGKTFKFNEPWIVIVNGERFQIPKEFKSDLTSTPAFLRSLLPITGSHVFAAILHDYIIHVLGDWKKANRIARIIIKHTKNIPILRKIIFIIGITFWNTLKNGKK